MVTNPINNSKILNDLFDTGKIKYIFKDLFVNDRYGYKCSMTGSVASHCVADKIKFYEFKRN